MKVILIGPVGSGKSTLSRLVADRLGIPCRHVDDLIPLCARELGYLPEHGERIRRREGRLGLYRHEKPIEAYAVERLLGEEGDAVVDFGGGHSVYEDDALLERVQAVLAPHPFVFLVRPTADDPESIRILRGRCGPKMRGTLDLHEHFVRHRSNRVLARHVIYTQGRTPEETCEAIVAIVQVGRADA